MQRVLIGVGRDGSITTALTSTPSASRTFDYVPSRDVVADRASTCSVGTEGDQVHRDVTRASWTLLFAPDVQDRDRAFRRDAVDGAPEVPVEDHVADHEDPRSAHRAQELHVARRHADTALTAVAR